VIGATGKTGRRVMSALQDRGLDARGVSRSTEIPFDWDDAATWPAALDGIDRAYVTYSPDIAIPGAVETVEKLVALAVDQGVKRIVLLTGRGEEEAQRAETLIQRPDLEWTVVRASWFMQNFSEGAFTGMVLDGTIALPAGDVPEPFIDVDDIAEVATVALVDEGHAGRVYEVTGPRAITFDQAVAELAEETGRDVRFQRIPAEAFVAELETAGLPDGVAWLLDYLFTAVLDGRNVEVKSGVEEALGRPPRDFRDYLRDAADAGAWEMTR
jgi:uncharacterized protein YbjT (DUF2867 family)